MSSENSNPIENSQQLLDEAEALIWGLLDENIDAASVQRLEKLLANSEVRQRYIQCVELHFDLQELFKDSQQQPKSPVLGSLSDFFPPPGFPSQANINPPLTD